MSKKKFKGYRLINFSICISSDWHVLSEDAFDLDLHMLEKWLNKGKYICLFYGPDFFKNAPKEIRNRVFSEEFKKIIGQYNSQIFVTTKDSKFVHPSHNNSVLIENYNPLIHQIFKDTKT